MLARATFRATSFNYHFFFFYILPSLLLISYLQKVIDKRDIGTVFWQEFGNTQCVPQCFLATNIGLTTKSLPSNDKIHDYLVYDAKVCLADLKNSGMMKRVVSFNAAYLSSYCRAD